MDYKTLPFRCRFFHEYGHLLRRCPRLKNSSLDAPVPPREDKGKAKASNGPIDSEGFTQVKSRNKGKGKKRTWTEKRHDDTFNRFDALENMDQEAGIPVEFSQEAIIQQDVHERDMQGEDQLLDTGDLQGKQVDNDELPLAQIMGDLSGAQGSQVPTRVSNESHRPKGVSDPVKNNKASLILGIQQKAFKKGSLDKPIKSGRKTYQERVKIMGENLVESGSVRPIDSHFSQPHK